MSFEENKKEIMKVCGIDERTFDQAHGLTKLCLRKEGAKNPNNVFDNEINTETLKFIINKYFKK